MVASMATGIDQTDWNRGTVTLPSTPFNFRLTSLKVQAAAMLRMCCLPAG